MEMNNTTTENRTIRRELVKQFPNYRVSVRQGKGTACGWKHIHIDTDIKEVKNISGCGLLPEVGARFNAISNKAKTIIRDNSELGHYYDDSGSSREHEQMIVQVNGIY